MSQNIAQVDEQQIKEIIEQDRINVLFQPLVCIRTKKVIGFESLARGVLQDSRTIMPADLFQAHLPAELLMQLDRLCRQKTLENFHKIHRAYPHLLIFMNMHPDILDQVDDFGWTEKTAEDLGINAENIVLEFPGDLIQGERFYHLTQYYRKKRFKLSIDNINRQVHVFDLVFRYRPNYLKLARSFYTQDSASVSLQEYMGILSYFCRNMNCKLVAHGVETESEALNLVMHNIFLQQGYLFAKDKDQSSQRDEADTNKGMEHQFDNTLEYLHKGYKENFKSLIDKRKKIFENYNRIIKKMSVRLENNPSNKMEQRIKFLLNEYQDAVSAFILNNNGVQVTQRLISNEYKRSLAVDEAIDIGKGTDHSLDDFFIHIENGYESFVTSPFISRFTQTPSCLFCVPFYSYTAQRYILCVEFNYPS